MSVPIISNSFNYSSTVDQPQIIYLQEHQSSNSSPTRAKAFKGRFISKEDQQKLEQLEQRSSLQAIDAVTKANLGFGRDANAAAALSTPVVGLAADGSAFRSADGAAEKPDSKGLLDPFWNSKRLKLPWLVVAVEDAQSRQGSRVRIGDKVWCLRGRWEEDPENIGEGMWVPSQENEQALVVPTKVADVAEETDVAELLGGGSFQTALDAESAKAPDSQPAPGSSGIMVKFDCDGFEQKIPTTWVSGLASAGTVTLWCVTEKPEHGLFKVEVELKRPVKFSLHDEANPNAGLDLDGTFGRRPLFINEVAIGNPVVPAKHAEHRFEVREGIIKTVVLDPKKFKFAAHSRTEEKAAKNTTKSKAAKVDIFAGLAKAVVAPLAKAAPKGKGGKSQQQSAATNSSRRGGMFQSTLDTLDWVERKKKPTYPTNPCVLVSWKIWNLENGTTSAKESPDRIVEEWVQVEVPEKKKKSEEDVDSGPDAELPGRLPIDLILPGRKVKLRPPRNQEFKHDQTAESYILETKMDEAEFQIKKQEGSLLVRGGAAGAGDDGPAPTKAFETEEPLLFRFLTNLKGSRISIAMEKTTDPEVRSEQKKTFKFKMSNIVILKANPEETALSLANDGIFCVTDEEAAAYRSKLDQPPGENLLNRQMVVGVKTRKPPPECSIARHCFIHVLADAGTSEV